MSKMLEIENCIDCPACDNNGSTPFCTNIREYVPLDGIHAECHLPDNHDEVQE